jgi:hypothetical protein
MRLATSFPVIAILAIATLAAAPAKADSATEPGASAPAQSGTGIVDTVIGEIEKRVMRDYYQRNLDEWERENGGKKKQKKNKSKSLPPGLAKRGELPPGLARQLVRNGELPPGLEGRDLPPDLLDRLPRLDSAYRYMIADNKVMLVKRATNTILDLLTVAAVDLVN